MAVRYENLTETLSLRVSQRMLQELQEHSQKTRLPVTKLMRAAIDEYLEKLDLEEARAALTRRSR